MVKFPSHQTHLLQPLNVGCFRQWKHFQQCLIWNAIRSYKAEYNICLFFCDLPALREKTFTKRTIKHSFQKSGMWPVSFKQVKRKLKEYRKKNKKDTGLDFLEFSGELDSSDSDDNKKDQSQDNPIADPQLEEEYYLPTLPPPLLYTDCVFQFQELDNKIEDILSSPTRHKYQVVYKTIDEFLMWGSLHEMEVKNARQGQINTHKAKLEARLSLSKGGSLLALDSIEKKKQLKRKAADDAIRKAKTKIRRYNSKAKSELHKRGIQARRDEKAHLQSISSNQILGIQIPDEKWLPI